MNGKRVKIIRKTCQLLFLNKEYMARFPDGYTFKTMYKRMKRAYVRGSA